MKKLLPIQKYLFAVLDKTEIIIYESNKFFRIFGKFPESFQKFFREYFSGKLTSINITNSNLI